MNSKEKKQKNSSIQDGIYALQVHGTRQILKFVEQQPNLLSLEKGKWKWCPTLICQDRMKKLRQLSEIELVRLALGHKLKK